MQALVVPRRRSRPRDCRRAGLAPLELTLALPLLLMAMALMVVLGAAGAWRVRTDANSRQAIFRAMWPRTTDNDAPPANWWPASAAMSYRRASGSPFDSDPFVDHIVVRGPSVTDPETGNQLTVLIDTLDMTDGLHAGHAEVNHAPAMWPRLGRRSNFSRDTLLFAGQTWQYGNLGLPGNETRRIEYTYDYDLSRYDPEAAGRTTAAANALLSNPDRPALAVLDSDQELHDWFHPGTSNPALYDDFHPRPPSACTSDPETLRKLALEPLLERIERVPERMARRFLRMYQEQLQTLRQGGQVAPGTLAELETKIRQLQDFLNTL